MVRTLRRRRNTLLYKFVESDFNQRLEIANFYSEESDFYFFDRNPDCFNEILDFCRMGLVHCPPNICEEKFIGELKFWDIPIKYVASCCCSEIVMEAMERQAAESVADKGRGKRNQENGSVALIVNDKHSSATKNQFAGEDYCNASCI